MKQQFFLVYFLLSSLTMMSQNLFKVIEVKRNEQYGLQGEEDTGVNYFRIVLSNDISVVSPTYPFVFPKDFDTLKAIDELLRFEGDTRLCVFPINNYDPARSQIYLDENKSYSLQVEALFIINQLIYDKPFNYASYPILVDKKTKRNYSVLGDVISDAFKAYKRWYKKLCKKGIEYVKEKNIMPLDNSTIRWY